jgi:hypothetical protein
MSTRCCATHKATLLTKRQGGLFSERRLRRILGRYLPKLWRHREVPPSFSVEGSIVNLNCWSNENNRTAHRQLVNATSRCGNTFSWSRGFAFQAVPPLGMPPVCNFYEVFKGIRRLVVCRSSHTNHALHALEILFVHGDMAPKAI